MPGIYGPTTPVDDFVIDSFGVRGPAGPSAVLPLTTAQVFRAARPILVSAGGLMSAFLATIGGPDSADGSWEAVHVEPFAPAGGVLSGLFQVYLASLGQSPSQVTASLATIWAAAPGVTP